MGAKSKYETNVLPNLHLVECWARDELTDKEIAKKLRISEDTFYVYKKKFSEFSESLKKGKEVVDYEVENALLKRAKGFEWTETTSELRDGEMVVTKEVVKFVSPETAAAFIWLKNRRPDKWRDKPETDGKGDTSLMEALLAVVKGGDK